MRLTQADLENEQRYWRMKRQLTNRAMGSGVVWGLDVTYDERRRSFRLSPGYAIDCCGNDLVVECAQELRAEELIDLRSRATQELAAKAGNGYVAAQLALQYAEYPEDPRSVHSAACVAEPMDCLPARIRESTRACLLPRADLCGSDHDAWSGQTRVPPPDAKLRVSITARDQTHSLEVRPGAWRGHLDLIQASSIDEIAITIELPDGWTFELSEWSHDVEVTPSSGNSPVGVRTILRIEDGKFKEPLLWVARLLGRGLVAHDSLEVGELHISLTVEVAVNPYGNPFAFGVSFSGVHEVRPARSCWDAARQFWRSDPCSRSGSEQGEARGEPLHVLVRAMAGQSDLAGDDQRVIESWCRSLAYPGPRCDTHHHGVALGTVTLDRKGGVRGWDPWNGRRHVLTFPLVSHWLTTFGYAPLDVMASRVAGAICCLAHEPATRPADVGSRPGPIEAAGTQSATPAATAQAPVDLPRPAPTPIPSRLPDGSILIAGSADEVQKFAAAQNARVEPGGARSHLSALRWLLEGRRESGQAGEVASFLDYQIGGPGNMLHLLMPHERRAPGAPPPAAAPEPAAPPAADDNSKATPSADDADATPARGAPSSSMRDTIRESIARTGATPGPVGEPAFGELVDELAAGAPLPSSGEFERAAGELAAGGVRSLGDAIAIGPEALYDRVADQPEPVPAADVNALWVAVTRQIDEIVARVWSVAKDRPEGAFTRRTLQDAAFVDRLASTLSARSKRGTVRLAADAVRSAVRTVARADSDAPRTNDGT